MILGVSVPARSAVVLTLTWPEAGSSLLDFAHSDLHPEPHGWSLSSARLVSCLDPLTRTHRAPRAHGLQTLLAALQKTLHGIGGVLRLLILHHSPNEGWPAKWPAVPCSGAASSLPVSFADILIEMATFYKQTKRTNQPQPEYRLASACVLQAVLFSFFLSLSLLPSVCFASHQLPSCNRAERVPATLPSATATAVDEAFRRQTCLLLWKQSSPTTPGTN